MITTISQENGLVTVCSNMLTKAVCNHLRKQQVKQFLFKSEATGQAVLKDLDKVVPQSLAISSADMMLNDESYRKSAVL